jgi:hypothetical protein
MEEKEKKTNSLMASNFKTVSQHVAMLMTMRGVINLTNFAAAETFVTHCLLISRK